MAFYHRYYHFYIQGTSELADGYVPDPVRTAGAVGIAQGANPSVAIENAVKYGKGANLLKFYQYADKRARMDYYSWQLAKSKLSDLNDDVINESVLKTIEPSLKDTFYHIIYEDPFESKNNAFHFYEMDRMYGINQLSFGNPSLGLEVVLSDLVPAETVIEGLENYTSKSWMIGQLNEAEYRPVILLATDVDINDLSSNYNYVIIDRIDYNPPKSRGISYVTSSSGITYEPLNNNPINYELLSSNNRVRLNDVVRTEINSQGDVVPRIVHPDEEGPTNPVLYNKLTSEPFGSLIFKEIISSDWEDPRDGGSGGIYDAGNDPDSEDSVLEEADVIEKVTAEFYRVKSKNQYDVIIYDVLKVQGEIIYDNQEFCWQTATNQYGIDVFPLLNNSRDTSSNAPIISSNNPSQKHEFKFYPFVPIKQNSRWLVNPSSTVNGSKVVNALKVINDNTPKDESIADGTSDRDYALNQRENRLERTAAINNAQRTIARADNYLRRIKTPPRFNKSSTSATRHLSKLCELLGTDFKEFTSNMQASSDYKMQEAYLQAGVVLASDKNEVMKYWFEFWKRMYRQTNNGGYIDFINEVTQIKNNAVSSANSTYILDLNELPAVSLDFAANNNNPEYKGYANYNGTIKFSFIRKFTFDANDFKTRSLPRIKETYDIRRGKPLPLLDKYQSEELKKLSKDIYDKYHSSNGGILSVDKPLYEAELANLIKLQGGELEFNINNDLQDLINPSKELAKDNYYSSPSKKDISIGGSNEFKGLSDTNYIAKAMFDNWGYTFFCKKVGDKVEVYAVAGLIGRTRKVGASLYMPAWFELNMFYKRNYKKYVQKKSDKDSQVSHELRWKSGKRTKTTTITNNYFILPLDYNILRRFGGTELMRFAERSQIVISYSYQHKKGRNFGIFSVLLQAIAIVVTVVGVITGGSTASIGAKLFLLAKAVVKLAVTKYIVKEFLTYVAEEFGIEGLTAIILAIVLVTLADMSGLTDLSSLPYASDAAKVVIAEAGDIINKVNKEELEKVQKLVQQENKLFAEKMLELEANEEDLQSLSGGIDTTQVLAALQTRYEDPELFFARTLEANPNDWAGEDFLSGFLSHKVSLNLKTFNLEKSTDFSLKNQGNEENEYVV